MIYLPKMLGFEWFLRLIYQKPWFFDSKLLDSWITRDKAIIDMHWGIGILWLLGGFNWAVFLAGFRGAMCPAVGAKFHHHFPGRQIRVALVSPGCYWSGRRGGEHHRSWAFRGAWWSQVRKSDTFFPHMLHGAGIFTYIWGTNRPNVGKYTIHGAYRSKKKLKARLHWFNAGLNFSMR